MKVRLAASAALALAIVVGGTGCAMVTYQATTEKYDASDGVSADVGALKLRNVLLVMEEGGDEASLVFTVSNTGDDDLELELGLADGDTQTVDVDAHSQLVFGGDGDDEEPLVIEDIDAGPGELATLYFSVSGAEGVEVGTPILDGRLPEYSDLVP
ncbi:DNA modification methylase [Agromyces sp. MMS24-JH15]|uniref:DNA modification methylase n=1 Tax=Agromyces sp. MMS24-JH15 TaxID=3243765 RepID=UPI0037486F0B